MLSVSHSLAVMSRTILLSLILTWISSSTTSARTDRVPVLMWTNDDSVTFPQTLAGHTVTAEDFNGNYMNQLLAKDNENIVLFIQDKLSVADISHYANVYGYKADDEEDVFANVKLIMSELSSTHLPNVLFPLSVLNTAREHHVNTETLNEPFFIEDKNDERSLFIVHLPATQQSNYRQSMSQIDKIIGSVTTQLRAMSLPFTALYTATASSRAPQIVNGDSSKNVRHLLSVGDSTNNGQFFNASDEIYLYMGNVMVSGGSNSSLLSLNKLTIIPEGTGCDNSTQGNSSCTLNLKYDDDFTIEGNVFRQFALTFTFIASGYVDVGYWTISGLNMTYANESQPAQSYYMDVSKIQEWTPVGLSYSCYAAGTIVAANATAAGSVLALSFQGFQIQAFGGKGAFGQYNDCQGFFSIPIWMAIICMAIMISILVFGIQMLSSITTMDRYDDAKGKTISVTASD